MAAENISKVFGTFGGTWDSSSAVISDGRNDLLAFVIQNGTYSTGVDDSLLVPGSFVPAKFRAFKPDPSELPSVGGLNAIPLSGTYDYRQSRAFYLSDGLHGLDLNTALFNIPKTELQFFASVTNANAITDNIPDVLVTQVGQPSTTAFDEFYFVDSGGNIVGNSVQIIFGGSSAVPSVGKQNWQFWNPNHTAEPNLNGSRDLRMRAYHLADFGITPANMGQITDFVQKLSGESDLSFVAYNEDAVEVPALLTVKKDNGQTQLQEGKTGVVYKVTIVNVGGTKASNVSWSDAAQGLNVTGIVPVTTAQPGDLTGLCSLTGCTGITLSPGNSFVYEVTADVTGAASTNGSNTATLDGGGCANGLPAQPGAECTSTDEDPIVPPTASITVTKDNNQVEVIAGSTIVYSVIITNNGENDVTGLSWTDVTDGLTVTNIAPVLRNTGAPGVCDNTGCTGIDLPAGSNIHYFVTATVTAAAGATVGNSAIVDGGECSNGTSANPNAICTAEDRDPVVTPALKISKTGNFAAAQPGDTVNYTVLIQNSGGGIATNVNWQETPQNMTITAIAVTSTSGGAIGGQCTVAGCQNITLPKNGGSVTYTVTATVNPNAVGNLVNTVDLSGEGCTPADCSSTAVVPITPVAPSSPASIPVDSRIMLTLLALLLMAGAWRSRKLQRN